MAVGAAIPQIWAARMLKNLNNEHVFVARFNRDYEGEIKSAGDTVRIQGIGRVAEGEYTRYSDITIEQLDVGDQTLTITEDRYFAFSVDDADEIQSKPDLMDAAMLESAFALANRADTFAGTALRDAIIPANKLSSVVLDGTDDPFETLVDLSVLLDENNVPSEGRFVIVPPFYYGALVKDDRATNYGTTANRESYRKGDVGMEVAGLRVFRSNNCPAGVADAADTAVIAGHSIAATWAEQIPQSSVEIFRPEKRFEDAVKGRYLYGAKVVRPYALAWVEANTA